ncbi:hypothetical protein SPRG_01362 [Saprolegnia parasitica CBS 223.65]|uniref:Uncharacterized protein n=1 Tax=Saprolegnia parasitica (strain CBS 223.65) TaxID=695850 RepID=A0A067CUA0_SAPPC|nr:hypothetical protein SPRG_01362 [Saprolegnia parasitica CBS 223.65]KDO34088.1 hypothetical protein SPRG_01362 [Saprolegnia parasitica CBS 223.65]|eukprot:XP_012194972.1 hypothetical protein SPRG_01362 [Saprolegnia parasitica CBS 223.65]
MDEEHASLPRPSIASLEHASLRYLLDVVPKLVQDAPASVKDEVGALLLDRVRAETEPEDGVNQLLRLMGIYLHSSEAITEAIVELLYGSCYRVVLIHHLPQLTYQSPKCINLVLQAYKDLLESDSALLVPLLGSLVDMPLSPSQQNDIVLLAHTMLDSVDETDVPSVIRSLLALLTPTTAAATLSRIRQQATSLSLPHLHLVLDVMSGQLYSGSVVLKYTLRSIRTADDLDRLDGLWLLTLLQRSSEHTTVWKCLLHMHKKISLAWLLSLQQVVASHVFASYQASYVQLCSLLFDVAFHKQTTLALGTTLISHAIQSLTALLRESIDVQSVLQLLLHLVGRSHTWNTTQRDGLRRHMAVTAAVGIADALPSLRAYYGHLVLDTIHVVSATKGDNTALLDPLCFAVVQLVPTDPSLYTLLVMTIQKHILQQASPLQLTSILLAAHLTYANVVTPTDRRTITAWMLRLLAYAPLSVVPGVATYLCAHVDASLAETHVLPALRRRRVLTSTRELSLVAYFQHHAGAPCSESTAALAELVRCLVAYAPPALLDDVLSQPLVSAWPDEFGPQESLASMFQAAIYVGVTLLNSLFAAGRRDAVLDRLWDQVVGYFDQHTQTAHEKTSLSYLRLLDDAVVCYFLTQLPPTESTPPSLGQARCIRLLYHGLVDRDAPQPPHWRLYGTYMNALRSHLALDVPWTAYITALTAATTTAESVAETLLQVYAILGALLAADRDALLFACAERDMPLWEAADAFYNFVSTNLLQLQDAQVLCAALDVLVLVCKPAPLMLQDVAQLGKTLLSTVYPHANVEWSAWKGYLALSPTPLAVTWLDHSSFLKSYAPTHASSSLYYLHHCYATVFALSPHPLPFLSWTADVLTTMVTDDVDVAPGLRTCTRASFPQLFTSFWLSLLSMATHPTLAPTPTRDPYHRITGYLHVLSKAIALAHIGDLYSSELARKTVPLLVRACQFLCERVVVVVDKCLQWRLSSPEIAADKSLLAPLCHHVLLVLDAMERYVQYIQALMVVHMKTVMEHAKGTTKLSTLAKTKKGPPVWTMLHRIPQVKQLPQLKRWIHRAKASLSLTMHREQIPSLDDEAPDADATVAPDESDGIRRTPPHDAAYRWQKQARKDQHVAWVSSDEDEAKDEDEAADEGDLWSGDEAESGFHAAVASTKSVRHDIEALQTPMKLRLHENATLGFASVVIDFKTKRTTRL